MTSNRSIAILLAASGLLGCSDSASSSSGSAPPVEQAQAIRACEAPFEAAITAPNPKYIWTPNAIRLASEELAPGVFAVYDENASAYGPAGKPLATSGGFVIGEDGVLLVESMINRQLFCQLIGLVRAQTDKPITYVVNTSSHGDHSFGNTFLPEGVKVVQHKETAAYIAAHFEEDVAFMEANFGADQGLDEIKPVAAHIIVESSSWTIDLGGVTVEAHHYGFGQTPGDLFVRVPSAKVVWTGNALVAEKPGIPWLLDGHAEEYGVTLAAVRDASPEDAIVVPGHGRPVSLEVFEFSIDYLSTLVAEVSASVEKGLTVEETAAAVSMDSFKGYAIWDWIHTTVNVPKTYAELKK